MTLTPADLARLRTLAETVAPGYWYMGTDAAVDEFHKQCGPETVIALLDVIDTLNSIAVDALATIIALGLGNPDSPEKREAFAKSSCEQLYARLRGRHSAAEAHARRTEGT